MLPKKTYILLSIICLLVSGPSTLVAGTVTSTQTGDWGNQSTWDCSCTPAHTDDVVIDSGHTVTLSSNQQVASLTIKNDAVLDDGSNDLEVTSNFTLDGTYTGSSQLTMTGSGATISGKGEHESTGDWVLKGGDKTITSSADIFKAESSGFIVDNNDNGDVLTNKGKFTSVGNIQAGGASTKWVNDTGSYLKVGGQPVNGGILEASAKNNTVVYYKGNADVKTPSANTYYNLKLACYSTCKLQDNLTIDGNLTITAKFKSNGYNINLRGDWTNTGSFQEWSDKVVFDGSNDQTITNAKGEKFYDVKVDKSAGTLILKNHTTVSNTLTMAQGDINTEDNKLILGTGTGNAGSLSHTSGTINGKFKRWINSTSTYLFPVGTSSHYRPASITFDNTLTSGSLIAQFMSNNPTEAGLPLEDGTDSVYTTFAEGYWKLEPANDLSCDDYDIDLTGNGFNSLNINSSTRLLTRSSSSDKWSVEGRHVSASGSTATRNGITSDFPKEHAFGDTTDCDGPQTSAIRGPDDVCADESDVEYSVNDHSDYSYSWDVDGGTITGGSGTNQITVDWGSDGQIGAIEAEISNTCKTAHPVDTNVQIHSIPPASIQNKMKVPENAKNEPYKVSNPGSGYTYNWRVSGGTIVTNNGDDIKVDWGAAGTGTLEVTADSGGCPSSSTVDTNITKYKVTRSSGNNSDWNQASTWDCDCVPRSTDNVAIDSGHTVNLTQSEKIHHIVIEEGATLNDRGNTFEIKGDLTLEGDYNGSGQLTLSGSGVLIDGSGTFSNTGVMKIKGGNKTILSNADLAKSGGEINLTTTMTVKNQGTFSAGGKITGESSNSTWRQMDDATLEAGDAVLATGTLLASSDGNEIIYNGGSSQTVKAPHSAYYHLILSNSQTKSLEANTQISGDLTIKENAELDVTTTDYELSVGGNWINKNTFQQRNGKVILNGSAKQKMKTSAEETFHNLQINNTLDQDSSILLTSGADIKITNELTLTDGVINGRKNGFKVIIPDDATVSDASTESYVVGKVRKGGNDAFEFPVGDREFMPVEMTAPSSTSDTFTAEYFRKQYHKTATDSTLHNVSKKNYWELNRNAGSSDIDVTLNWLSRDWQGIDDCSSNSLVVAHYKDGNWVSEGRSSAQCADPGSITSNTVSSFSPMTVGSDSDEGNTLPVDLLHFTAEMDHNKAVITWQTATETANDQFVVQKSLNGEQFQNLSRVDGAGTSYETQEYITYDNNPAVGTNYYRLKQVDLNGEANFSKIVSIENQPKETASMKLLQNPVKDELIFQTPASDPAKSKMRLLNLKGEVVHQQNLSTSSGHRVQIPSIVSSGVYILSITSKNAHYHTKVVIQ